MSQTNGTHLEPERYVTAIEENSARLVEVLAGVDPTTPVPTCSEWTASDLLAHNAEVHESQSEGAALRRQGHEAAMRRLDAELTAAPDGSARTMLEPMLATDAVSDMLGLVTAATPDPATGSTARGSGLLRIVASDTGTTWLVTVDAAAGAVEVAETDPADGTVRPDAIYTGTAEDLLCTFWKRPALTAPHSAGDPNLVATFEQAVSRFVG